MEWSDFERASQMLAQTALEVGIADRGKTIFRDNRGILLREDVVHPPKEIRGTSTMKLKVSAPEEQARRLSGIVVAVVDDIVPLHEADIGVPAVKLVWNEETSGVAFVSIDLDERDKRRIVLMRHPAGNIELHQALVVFLVQDGGMVVMKVEMIAHPLFMSIGFLRHSFGLC